MANNGERLARRPGEEYEAYVRRLERNRLRAVGEFKEELGDALDLAAQAADDETDRQQAEIAARAMRAAAREFKEAVEGMEVDGSSQDGDG